MIARWFFMAQTTGRYTGSFESQFEQDASRVAALASGAAEAFCRTLDRIVADTLGNDYWTTTLPNELATSAAKSPALMAYIASLNILDAEPLLSTGKVRARLDPAVTSRKGIERHHLFPRAYLKQTGIVETKRINQIANMALVDWSDNIVISDQPPTQYWPAQIAQKRIGSDRLAQQRYWHALPADWEMLSYDDFLDGRRRLMGKVVRDAFAKLTENSYAPTYPAPSPSDDQDTRVTHAVTITDLIAADLLPADTALLCAGDSEIAATVCADGRISFGGDTYDTPSSAAAAASGASPSGWTYWVADLADGHFTLSSLRETFLSSPTSLAFGRGVGGCLAECRCARSIRRTHATPPSAFQAHEHSTHERESDRALAHDDAITDVATSSITKPVIREGRMRNASLTRRRSRICPVPSRFACRVCIATTSGSGGWSSKTSSHVTTRSRAGGGLGAWCWPPDGPRWASWRSAGGSTAGTRRCMGVPRGEPTGDCQPHRVTTGSPQQGHEHAGTRGAYPPAAPALLAPANGLPRHLAYRHGLNEPDAHRLLVGAATRVYECPWRGG